MFTKLLITVAIIAVVIWVATRKRQSSATAAVTAELPPSPQLVWLQRLAPLFAIVVLLLAAAWYGYGWLQGQQLLQVTVTSAQGEVATYQVKKRDLQGRKLVTVNGLEVVLSQMDRIEVEPIQ
ncbi:hypothetical protein [Ferrimonas senticii]|uniref:hypothetical protein n=1 Tax=Ferrimonas senticii TaxID=394566 RepID=UPI0004014B11|nr:hypothetical protein [Ferrimonas senticii]